MNNRKKKINSLRNICNVLTNERFFKEIIDVIIEESGIRYTIKDTTKFSILYRALFGNQYQSGYFKVGDFQAITHDYYPYSTFFRARRVDHNKNDYIYSDFWEPPKENIGRGRLNKENETMLYLGKDIPTVIREARVAHQDIFMLMIYYNIETLSLTEIGESYDDDIAAFMSEQFSKNGNNAYEISERLAKEIYQFENDGWCYPSVLHNNGGNVCLNLEAKSKLKLIGAFLVNGVANNETPRIIGVFDFSDKDNIKIIDDWNNINSKAEELKKSIEDQVKMLRKQTNEKSKNAKAIENIEPIIKAVIVPRAS